MELIQHKSGMWIRPGTMDVSIISEVKRHYGWLDFDGKRVLDVGANIGCFSRMALDRGASAVFAYEPDQDNYDLLRQNAPEATAVRAALTSGDEERVKFYKTKSGKNPGNYSTVPSRGRIEEWVPARNFATVLEEVEPDIIKFDCEGAEYDLLTVQLPDCVEQVAMEIHLQKPEFKELAPQVVEMFQDWECRKEPKWNDKSWTAQAGWRKLGLVMTRPLDA